jgi:hypothetical protein
MPKKITKTRKRNSKPNSKRNSKKTNKRARSRKTDNNIVDVPFSKARSKGTYASSGDIHFHYQNYSNVMNYLKSLNITNACFFKNRDAFLNLNIDKKNMSVKTMGSDKNLFLSDLRECLKTSKRFIPIILNLATKDGNHANILLIDKQNEKIELFEPHGSRDSESVLGSVKGAYSKKIRELKKFWRSILPEYNVVNVVDYRRGTHFQMEYDPENHSGFCVTWSILFAHYRLLNPDVKPDTLIKYLSKKINTVKLLQYAKYVEESIKHKV